MFKKIWFEFYFQISVEKHVYLFDFLVLGKNLFKKGLKSVLESKKITKVDCLQIILIFSFFLCFF